MAKSQIHVCIITLFHRYLSINNVTKYCTWDPCPRLSILICIFQKKIWENDSDEETNVGDREGNGRGDEIEDDVTDENAEMLTSSKSKPRKCGFCGVYVSINAIQGNTDINLEVEAIYQFCDVIFIYFKYMFYLHWVFTKYINPG